MPYLQEQLDFLVYLTQFRSTILNAFFYFLVFFDTPYFIFLLIPTIWLGCSWKWGIRLGYVAVISLFLNSYFKDLFQLPRPDAFIASLPLLQGMTSPGFPSGGAQTSCLLGGFLIYAIPSFWTKIVGVVFALLIGFSRLYLGVHFPIDVLGGYVLALIILFLFILLHQKIEFFLKKSNPYLTLFISILIPVVFLFIYPRINTFSSMGILIAFNIGIFFSLIFRLYLSTPQRFISFFLRSIIGCFGVFFFYFLTKYALFKDFPEEASIFFEDFVLALWVSLAASPLLKIVVPKTKWMNLSH